MPGLGGNKSNINDKTDEISKELDKEEEDAEDAKPEPLDDDEIEIAQ